MPFQGAYIHTNKTQGVALGYGLVGLQPVSHQFTVLSVHVQLLGFGFPFGHRFSILPIVYLVRSSRTISCG